MSPELKALVKPPCCMEGTGCELPPCHCSQVAAAVAVAAFLRALPLHNRWGDRRDYYPDRMADEVERAAKEGGDGR